MAGFTKAETIWFNGAFVPWDEARVHVLAHGLQYGTGVFEGIRSYDTPDGPAVFRLDAHTRRFFESAAMYELEIPYSQDAIISATVELVRRNGLGNAYIRPIVFVDAHTLNLWPKGSPISVAIAGFAKGAYLEGALETGARVTISPVRKFNSSAIPATGKACGQYINSVRAVQDAIKRGFDEAILLNDEGDVAEGSGENLFVVKDGAILTNGPDASILMGVTRDAVLTLANDLGLRTSIGPITVQAMLTADELFFTGTAAEVTPIREIDGRPVGDGRRGPVTAQLQKLFFEVVQGKRPEYKHWLAYVNAPVVTV
jgi:branched-chain amino acid aminotransferase